MEVLQNPASGFEYHYSPLDRLGLGAFGQVYSGIQRRLGSDVSLSSSECRRVALKLIEVSDSAEAKRFASESALLQTLGAHHHILSYVDSFRTPCGRGFCLVTSLCAGGSLLDAAKRSVESGEREREWVEFVRARVGEVLDALVYMHRAFPGGRRYLHKDLKADNILLSAERDRDSERGESSEVYAVVADFGLGRSTTAPSSYIRTHRVCRFYTPPGHIEAVERSQELQWRAHDDVYQVGLLVLELVCRRLPPGVDTTRPVCSDTEKLEWWRTETKRLCEAAGCLELWCGAERMLEYADEVTAEEARRIVDGGRGVPRERVDETLRETARLQTELQELRLRDGGPSSLHTQEGVEHANDGRRRGGYRRERYQPLEAAGRLDAYGTRQHTRNIEYSDDRRHDSYRNPEIDHHGDSASNQYGNQQGDFYSNPRSDRYNNGRNDRFGNNRNDRYADRQDDQYGFRRSYRRGDRETDQYDHGRSSRYERRDGDRYGNGRRDRYADRQRNRDYGRRYDRRENRYDDGSSSPSLSPSLSAANAELITAGVHGNTVRTSELLRTTDADPRSTDPRSGKTALHYAAGRGHLETILTLLADPRSNATINLRSSLRGMTPLHMAVYAQSPEVVRELVRSGADKGVPDAKGVTPEMVARHRGYHEVLRALMEA